MKTQLILLLAAAQAASAAAGHVDSSTNWAGAVHTSSYVTYATGTLTLPPYKPEPGRGASFWVGIDGSSCRNAILQTGVDYLNGTVYPWYEWWPADTKFYTQPLSVKPGDVVRMSVKATSPTSGSASIENLTTGEAASVDMVDQEKLCLKNAEWIVEDVAQGLVDFGTLEFSQVRWDSALGSRGASGARVYDLKRAGKQSTKCRAGDTVVCEFAR